MEEQTTKIFWKPIDSDELKEIKGISNFELSIPQQEDVEEVPFVPPVEVTYNPIRSHTLAFDVELEDWQIRKLCRVRIPRKLKKKAKKCIAGIAGKSVKDLRYNYMGTLYWKIKRLRKRN